MIILHILIIFIIVNFFNIFFIFSFENFLTLILLKKLNINLIYKNLKTSLALWSMFLEIILGKITLISIATLGPKNLNSLILVS